MGQSMFAFDSFWAARRHCVRSCSFEPHLGRDARRSGRFTGAGGKPPASSNLRLELIDSNGDGFPDSGSLQVNNHGDFELRSRIANVGVRIDYEDNSSVTLFADRYDKGKWDFYLDSDGSKGFSDNDVKFGEVWIKYGSYYLDGDQFYVPGGGSKDLKVELKYQPYAPGKTEGVKYYAVFFDIVMLENRR